MDAIKHLAAGAALLSVLLTADAYTQVADTTTPTPPLHYESGFSDYRPQQDTPLLPWKNLFTADGDFSDATPQAAPMEIKVRKPQSGHRGHDAHGSGRKVTLDTQTDTPAQK
jgi:hypothetical protein